MLNKNSGMSRSHWTRDEIFKTWYFCNVNREDDKTTAWFRENVRYAYPEVGGLIGAVQGTIIYRWFNQIQVGEILKRMLLNPEDWSSQAARIMLKDVKPVVNGAYIILGQQGLPKLEGVLACIDDAIPMIPKIVEKWTNNGVTLQSAWADLKTINYLGPFMSYEVVTDLRHVWPLTNAKDIMTWANAGPGCARGLGRVVNGDCRLFNRGSKEDQSVMVEQMKQLLEMSKDSTFWPYNHLYRWEMRTVEHWACEYHKYCNAVEGERLKRRYR